MSSWVYSLVSWACFLFIAAILTHAVLNNPKPRASVTKPLQSFHSRKNKAKRTRKQKLEKPANVNSCQSENVSLLFSPAQKDDTLLGVCDDPQSTISSPLEVPIHVTDVHTANISFQTPKRSKILRLVPDLTSNLLSSTKSYPRKVFHIDEDAKLTKKQRDGQKRIQIKKEVNELLRQQQQDRLKLHRQSQMDERIKTMMEPSSTPIRSINFPSN